MSQISEGEREIDQSARAVLVRYFSSQTTSKASLIISLALVFFTTVQVWLSLPSQSGLIQTILWLLFSTITGVLIIGAIYVMYRLLYFGHMLGLPLCIAPIAISETYRNRRALEWNTTLLIRLFDACDDHMKKYHKKIYYLANYHRSWYSYSVLLIVIVGVIFIIGVVIKYLIYPN